MIWEFDLKIFSFIKVKNDTFIDILNGGQAGFSSWYFDNILEQRSKKILDKINTDKKTFKKTDKKADKTASYDLSEFEKMALMSTPKGSKDD